MAAWQLAVVLAVIAAEGAIAYACGLIVGRMEAQDGMWL